MADDALRIRLEPSLDAPAMVLALGGWMDGGEVSTGSVDYLTDALDARVLAEIDADGFYILNFPGSMELAAMFRPHVEIEGGLIRRLDMPTNTFFSSEPDNLILFSGVEPNLRWRAYADCIFEVAERFGVESILFIGSFAGLVPHSRLPRLFSSVSDGSMKAGLDPLGIRFSDYTGPGSLATFLTREAGNRGLKMVSLVDEIPAYVQGRNPKCIEAVVRHLAVMLDLQVDVDELRHQGDRFEERVNKVVTERPELAEQIAKLESEYDSEVFETQMPDLKDWLHEKGIRLD